MCLHPMTRLITQDGLTWRQTFPCGKCPECLKRKRKDWMYRLFMENRMSESSFFITLTYDPEHLPPDGVCKDDVQRFFKRLRKHIKCRYFLVSEYGDMFHRSHYHLILFLSFKIRLADIVHLIDKCWQLGNIQVGDVTIKSIAYCAKYCMKDKQPEQALNRCFSLMSRKPGIGDMDLSTRFETNNYQDFLLGSYYNPPRYYRDKYFNNKQLINYRLKIYEYASKKNNQKDLFERQAKGREWIHRYAQLQRKSRTRKS